MSAALRLVPPVVPPAPTLRRYLGQSVDGKGRRVIVTRWAPHWSVVWHELFEQAERANSETPLISVQPIAEAA